MSQSGGRRGAQGDVARALGAGSWIPLESGCVKEDGTARYVPFPQPHARDQNLDQGTKVDYQYHPSGALLVLPPGCDVDDVLVDLDE